MKPEKVRQMLSKELDAVVTDRQDVMIEKYRSQQRSNNAVIASGNQRKGSISVDRRK